MRAIDQGNVLKAKTILAAILFNLPLFPVFAQVTDDSTQNAFEVVFSTYFGGSGTDDCDTVTVDEGGNIYLGCHLNSPSLPGSDKHPYSLAGNMDAFVIKLNAAGDAVHYITHLGGAEWDAVQGITTDAEGNAYLVGTTYSKNFPVSANAQQQQFGGESDAFVAKLNATGEVQWLTYFGGRGEEDGAGIALDDNGIIHIVGRTSSPDLLTTADAVQAKLNGGKDAFIARFNGQGKPIYSSYLGGSNDDQGFAITLDAMGSTYITGSTQSTDFPIFDPNKGKTLFPKPFGGTDAFVAVLNPDGTALEYFTYLGGTAEDSGLSIGLAPDGGIIIAGQTNSPDLPTTKNAAQTKIAGGIDTFVTKLNIADRTLPYMTYLGGSDRERTRDLAVDTHGNAIIVGETQSPNFPSSVSSTNKGNENGFLTFLNPTGTQFTHSITLGGEKLDAIEGVAIGKDNNMILTGLTNSPDFPTVSPLQPQFIGGRFDIVVSRFHSPR